MLDKIEPPIIPDGYGISVAYACLLDIIRSLTLTIEGPAPQSDQEPKEKQQPTEEEHNLHCQLINSSWCGLLAALSPLIEASTDETATENVLKAIQTYAALCGLLDLQTPRDAFITAICKASLPPHYALTILNTVPSLNSGIRSKQLEIHNEKEFIYFFSFLGHTRSESNDMNLQYMNSYADTDYRQQVVAVGTPLPTSSLPVGK